MNELLEQSEARRVRVGRTIDALQQEIAGLGEQLAAARQALERLEITRRTVLELTAEDTTPAEPLPPGYRDVLALFTQDDGDGLHAKDACRALGHGTGPRHVENMRAKLKRLVDRGVLTEPEPGLFTRPHPTPEINPNWEPAKACRTPS
ncbi:MULTISPECIES: hypothetical protein [unclassified Frankia]|uniref:hypothetical protein n=1 Tax=unclassified Frankia TaxID=2632575 RepID=UPI002024E234